MGLYHGIKDDTSLWQPKQNAIPGKATQAVWPRVDKTPETEPGFAGRTQRYLLGCEMTLVPPPASLSPGLADLTYKIGREFAQTEMNSQPMTLSKGKNSIMTHIIDYHDPGAKNTLEGQEGGGHSPQKAEEEARLTKCI